MTSGGKGHMGDEDGIGGLSNVICMIFIRWLCLVSGDLAFV